MLSGLIGKKLGVTQIFDEDGSLEAVTAIEAGPCFVSQIKTQAKDGYNVVQLGFSETKRLNSPEKGHLKGTGRQLKYLREFRVNDPNSAKVGEKVDVGNQNVSDEAFVFSYGLSLRQIVSVISHELGHLLGYKHNHRLQTWL